MVFHWQKRWQVAIKDNQLAQAAVEVVDTSEAISNYSDEVLFKQWVKTSAPGKKIFLKSYKVGHLRACY